MAGKVKKVTRLEEETGRETVQRAVKQGSLQESIDKMLDRAGNPVSEKTLDVLKKVHPDVEVAGAGVDAVLKTGMLALFAEVAGASGILGSKIPGLKKIDEEKYQEMAAYLRSYAGQRLGTQSADAMFAIAPVFASMLNNPALKEILEEDSNESLVPQLTEGNPEERLDIEKELAKLGKNEDEDE